MRVLARIVVALLFALVVFVAAWVWMAAGCLAWDPPPGSYPQANCGTKRNVAEFIWLLGLIVPLWWAFQPRKHS